MSIDAHVYVQPMNVMLLEKLLDAQIHQVEVVHFSKLFVKFDCGGMYVCIVMEMSYSMYVWKVLYQSVLFR